MTDPLETPHETNEAPESQLKPEQSHPRRGAVVIGIVVVAALVALAPWLRDQFAPAPIYVQEVGHEVTGHRYLYDRLLGWRNIPGWTSTTFGHPLTINSLGMRDREYTRKKPPGTTRILILGGSFTWGYGVADGENYTDVLEASFAESDRTRVEVLNTGVSGWGTDQEYLYLKNEGFEYEPDLVVAAFNLTEHPVYCVNSVQFGLAKPMFLDATLKLGNVPVPEPDQHFPKLTCQASDEELAIAILRQMAIDCEKHNCKLVIMKFGAFYYRHDPETRGNSTLQQALARRDQTFHDALTGHPSIHFFDLDEAFETHGLDLPSLLEGNHDGHWNAFGHRQVGEILHSWLTAQKLAAPSDKSTSALN